MNLHSAIQNASPEAASRALRSAVQSLESLLRTSLQAHEGAKMWSGGDLKISSLAELHRRKAEQITEALKSVERQLQAPDASITGPRPAAPQHEDSSGRCLYCHERDCGVGGMGCSGFRAAYDEWAQRDKKWYDAHFPRKSPDPFPNTPEGRAAAAEGFGMALDSRPESCPRCSSGRLPLSKNDRESGNCLFNCGTSRISNAWRFKCLSPEPGGGITDITTTTPCS